MLRKFRGLSSDIGQRATPVNGLSPYFISISDSQILNLSFEIAIKYGDGSFHDLVQIATGDFMLSVVQGMINS